MEETLMIIDVKDWNRRLQDAVDKAFPGKKLKIDENTRSVSRMIKDSLDRRGIADEEAQEKERRGIIATLKASDLGDDLGLYIRAFGGQPKADKRKRSKRDNREPQKRKDTNPPEKISPRSEEYLDIYAAGRRLTGSYGSNQ
jgi:hypothetical protein